MQKKRPPYAGGGIRKKAAYAAFSSALPEGYGNIRRFFPAKTSTVTLCFIPPPGDTCPKAHALRAERSPAGQIPRREAPFPAAPSLSRARHGKRAAGCPAALNGPRAFFLLTEKRRLFLPPKLPASGEKSPGMTAATSFPVCLIGEKPSRPGAFLTSFPPGKQAAFRRRKAHGHNRAPPAQGFVMRTSGRPAPRRKRRSSPPACTPPAHGPSSCRR